MKPMKLWLVKNRLLVHSYSNNNFITFRLPYVVPHGNALPFTVPHRTVVGDNVITHERLCHAKPTRCLGYMHTSHAGRKQRSPSNY